jgi:hypothetical protein
MVMSFFRIAVGAVVVFAIALCAVPVYAAARELATAQGTITISEARPGLRAPVCSELIVEARDALDNHFIAQTRPATNEAATCRYALTVPAQTAVWLRVQPMLVAGARVIHGTNESTIGSESVRPSSAGVALRFTIIAPTTYFFGPNEEKTVPLSY